MTATTLPLSQKGTVPLRQSRLMAFFPAASAGSRGLSLNALLLLAGFVLSLLLMQVDDRTLIGANVWHKPAKFFFSLALQFGTVAWALSLVEPAVRASRSVRWASLAMIVAAWAEMAYIVFRASRGEASHFNFSSTFAEIAYSLMGAGAFTITAATAWIGVVIWRHREGSLWREAAGVGLFMGAVLTILAGFYLGGNQTGHWVGGEMTDANGLRVFLWSTTGGDLRIAHFVGQHAMQAVPFAALSGRRSVVYATALAILLATGAVFVQAVMGIPLFRL